MTAFRPEADPEYSRGPGASSGQFRRSDPGATGSSPGLAIGVLATGLAATALLLVAEFTPLLHVHTTATRSAVASVQTGSHDSFALVPIAVLAALFSLGVWRTRNRLSLLAIGVLGVAALLIALLRDLPSAQASGITSRFILASSTPSVGFYLETLGAVLLMLTSVAGLLLLEGPAPRQRPRPPAPDPAHGPRAD